MAMKVVLFIDDECPPCQDAIEAMTEFISAKEVEVMGIHQGLKEYELGDPEGVPFMAVISPSTKKIINKIYFQDSEAKEAVTLEQVPTIPKAEHPAVIPTRPSPVPSPKDELEFVADSPEYLAYTIQDIGYREKLDSAFETAIAKAKGK